MYQNFITHVQGQCFCSKTAVLTLSFPASSLSSSSSSSSSLSVLAIHVGLHVVVSIIKMTLCQT